MNSRMTPYQLAIATGRSVWSLEDLREEMADDEWDAFCEAAVLDACDVD